MLTKSIANLDLFKILDEETNEICYGSNQNWYPTEWGISDLMVSASRR